MVAIAAASGLLLPLTWWINQVRLERAIAAEQARELGQAHEVFEALSRTTPAPSAPGAAQSPREQVVPGDDGRLLWASPTAGAPISLAYVPSGVQCLLFARPAALTAHPEGQKVLSALGPWGGLAARWLKEAAGCAPQDVDALVAAVVVNRAGEVDAAVRIDLAQPWDQAELRRRLPQAQRQGEDADPYYLHAERALFLAPDEGDRSMLIVCPVELVAELQDSAGAAPLVSRDMEALLAATDAERTATFLVAPKFLDAGGVPLVRGAREPLREALEDLTGSDATAVAVSMHWGDSFFAELRAAPALGTSPRWLATTLVARLAVGADDLSREVAANRWTPYAAGMIERFPAMIRQVSSAARGSAEGGHAVVRAYLPAVAGHNLVMGAELMLSQRAGAPSLAAGSGPSGGAGAPPGTIVERLDRVASLAFPKETLERALELLAEELGAPIAIDGPSLAAAGITRNQSLALDLRDRPAGEILVAILRQANPDRAAEGPADPRQTLVYVVDDEGAGGLGRIIVTTRAAALDAGRALPAPFAIPVE